MSKLEHAIPEELLLEIFQHLDPAHDLRSVLSTSRQFARIARPLAFSAFTVAIYGRNNALEMPDPDTLGKSKSRIDFFLSANIAPLVRSCLVFLHRNFGGGDEEKYPEYDSYPWLDYLLGRLDALIQLRDLRILHLYLPFSALPAIQSLPQLRTLDLEQCSLYSYDAEDEPLRDSASPLLQVLRLPRIDAWASPCAWNTFISPQHLVELSASISWRGPSWWNQKPSDVPVLPHVRKLTIFISPRGNWDSDGSAILRSKFPAVQEIIVVTANGERVRALELEALVGEALCSVSSVRRLLAPVGAISQAALTELPLTHYSSFVPKTSRRYPETADTLTDLRPSNTLTSLALVLGYIVIAELSTIIAFFPHLAQLRVEFSDCDAADDDDYDLDLGLRPR
ncbi:hypothetical protein MKEN_01339600 [Mycena kentingensis (nom. inval.)]|nr:hypothetical protein MKEN_01339600 [Mycena kentingensis (nom. inval.)]